MSRRLDKFTTLIVYNILHCIEKSMHTFITQILPTKWKLNHYNEYKNNIMFLRIRILKTANVRLKLKRYTTELILDCMTKNPNLFVKR